MMQIQKQEICMSPIRLFLFLFIIPVQCSRDAVIVTYEGQTAEITFTFENVFLFTLGIQSGNEEPFYHNGNFTYVGLQAGQKERFDASVEEYDNNIVVVQLTIRNISRQDGGTYSCSALTKKSIVPKIINVGLVISYPPGKAECKILSNNEIESGVAEMWDVVRCFAEEGNIPGKLLCYQDGIIAPHTKQHHDYKKMLSLEVWKRKEQSMYCCSAEISTHVDSMECTDSFLPGKK